MSQAFHVELPAESLHRDLEGLGAAVAAEGNDFAVHDQIAHVERAHRVHDLGDGRCHVAQIAREHANLIAALVDLDTCAIELPLERDVVAQLSERIVHVFGRLREHRLNRLKQLHTEVGKAGVTAEEGGPRDGGKRAGHHHRAAH